MVKMLFTILIITMVLYPFTFAIEWIIENGDRSIFDLIGSRKNKKLSKKSKKEIQNAFKTIEEIEKMNEKEEMESNAEIVESINQSLIELESMKKKLNTDKEMAMLSKLFELKEVLRKLLKRVMDAPEIIPNMRKLQKHYLPSLNKALTLYLKIDGQNNKGKNITEIKKKIIEFIDSSIIAFNKLYDESFENVGMDLIAEMEAMKTLYVQHGLTGEKENKRENVEPNKVKIWAEDNGEAEKRKTKSQNPKKGNRNNTDEFTIKKDGTFCRVSYDECLNKYIQAYDSFKEEREEFKEKRECLRYGIDYMNKEERERMKMAYDYLFRIEAKKMQEIMRGFSNDSI